MPDLLWYSMLQRSMEVFQCKLLQLHKNAMSYHFCQIMNFVSHIKYIFKTRPLLTTIDILLFVFDFTFLFT